VLGLKVGEPVLWWWRDLKVYDFRIKAVLWEDSSAVVCMTGFKEARDLLLVVTNAVKGVQLDT